MKLKLPLLLLQAVMAASLINAEETINYDPQAQQNLTSDYSPTIDKNMSYSHGNNAISIDGSNTYNITLSGQKSTECLLFENSQTALKGKIGNFNSLNSVIFRNLGFNAVIMDANDYQNRAVIGLDMSLLNHLEFSHNDGNTNGGGAVLVRNGSAVFHDIKTVLINDNSGTYNGGALSVGGNLLFYNVGFLQANNNILNSRNNSSAEGGGALGIANSSNASATRFVNNGKIEFKGNQAVSGGFAQYLGGGAISARCELSFLGNGDITFHDNIADGRQVKGTPQYDANGGAIRVLNRVYLDATDPNSHRVDFSADKGNIEFRGNRVYRKAWGDLPRMNSVSAQAHQFNVRAQDGYEVRFYDPIDVSLVLAHGIGNSQLLDGVYFNAPEQNGEINQQVYGGASPDFNGAIRFSGLYTGDVIKQAEGEDDDSFANRLFRSRYSQINADLHMQNGTLIVESHAVLGLIMEGFHYTTYAPVMVENDIVFADAIKTRKQNFLNGRIQLTTEGVIMGPNITVGGPVIWRSDGSGHLISETVDWSQGTVYDFDYSLKNSLTPFSLSGENNMPAYTEIANGVRVYANTISLGGDLQVADNERTYANSAWKGNKKFLVISDVKGTRNDTQFDHILSSVTGSAQVSSPYAYKGTWSLDWEGNDLYAYWTYLNTDDDGDGKDDGDIEEIDPELMGSLTENSLWMTGSNMKSLSRTNHRQMGTYRLLDKKCSNFWATGLGHFINQRNKGGIQGFDYNGGGYAVGYDTRLCPASGLFGISFGQLAGTGKNRRTTDNMTGSVDQNTLMGQLYGGYIKEWNREWTYNLSWTCGYGRSHNKMHSTFSSNASTFADWNNDAFLADIISTWDYKWQEHWTVSPFIGLEYMKTSYGSFAEWGAPDYQRRFGAANMSYLRMPVGLTFKHQKQLENTRFWINSLSVSYLPDIYRKDPDGMAQTISNDFIWDVKSASPARNAVRMDANSYYRFTESWGVYAGYSIEARTGSTYQQVNLGMNKTF